MYIISPQKHVYVLTISVTGFIFEGIYQSPKWQESFDTFHVRYKPIIH